MSYQKIKVSRSTQVAFAIFNMFKGNTVNMVRRLSEDEPIWVQYEEEDGYTPVDVDEPKPYDNDKLEFISTLLQGHDQEIRIHDVEGFGHYYEKYERRRVQFLFKNQHHGKVIFTADVGREYCDGDEVSGHTAWQMDEVTIQTFGKEKLKFRLRPIHVRTRYTEGILSREMKENIGHPVFFMKF